MNKHNFVIKIHTVITVGHNCFPLFLFCCFHFATALSFSCSIFGLAFSASDASFSLWLSLYLSLSHSPCVFLLFSPPLVFFPPLSIAFSHFLLFSSLSLSFSLLLPYFLSYSLAFSLAHSLPENLFAFLWPTEDISGLKYIGSSLRSCI